MDILWFIWVVINIWDLFTLPWICKVNSSKSKWYNINKFLQGVLWSTIHISSSSSSFLEASHSCQTGIIPWAAKRFSIQKITSFAVIFFSSTRNGSTVLTPEPYEDREKPLAPVLKKCSLFPLCNKNGTKKQNSLLPVRTPSGKNAQNE